MEVESVTTLMVLAAIGALAVMTALWAIIFVMSVRRRAAGPAALALATLAVHVPAWAWLLDAWRAL